MKYILQMLLFRWTKVRAGRRDLEPRSGTLSRSLGNNGTKQPGNAGRRGWGPGRDGGEEDEDGTTSKTVANGIKTENRKTTSRSKQLKREP